MASDESDDEPLAVLAATKKSTRKNTGSILPDLETNYERPMKRKVKNNQQFMVKRLPLTIKIGRKVKDPLSHPVGTRPEDVWLYLKDFNAKGPYSCLLCPEWFIGKAKVLVHYILNHKKDFCGICRYFVPDRTAWEKHILCHTPWSCSQCTETFPTEQVLRIHLKSVHNLVHCRLCHFRMPAGDQYHTHLLQKHNVTNVLNRDDESVWELDFESRESFLCLLCSKPNNPVTNFVNHFMSHHHFTIKCFSTLISGKDLPFTVKGADLSPEFIETLKGQEKCGYGNWKQKDAIEQEQNNADNENILKELLVEIKHETVSDNEEEKSENDENIKQNNEFLKSYQGEQDFDVTSVEFIAIKQFYFDYLRQSMAEINENLVPDNSNIEYDSSPTETSEIECSLCSTKHSNIHTLQTHVHKMHNLKIEPIFSCRVCATTFETQNELENHTKEELGEFEDLWICQFCDKEFDNRQSTRRHLTEHFELIEYNNCFSPHLGFKCKYCPTLFWNETDREHHQIRVHLEKNREEFYQCECSEIFSDKVWFTYHYILAHQMDDSNSTYLLKCCHCAVVLPDVDQMRSHFVRKHPESKKIYCSLEGCKFKPLSHKKSFQLHLRTKHCGIVRKDRVCQCSTCGQEFPSARARNTHVTIVHGAGKFKCKICDEMLHSIDERKLHYLLIHPGHHPFSCTICGKSFQYKSSLYIHKRDHAPNKQSFTCSYCQKVFAKKDSFREHIQIHEGPRHGCSYCPMRFVQRSNMLRHERRHTGERPYSCPHCDRKFADKGACTAHVRTHTKEASYACVYCGSTFAQKSKLTYHIRKHTGENLETCTICSKIFTSACSLREHMKTHQEKKGGDVRCPLCDKSYKDDRYMLRHLRTVHTGATFTCPLCPKVLSSAVSQRMHVLTHSRLNLFRCKCCPKSYAVKRTIIKHLRRRHSLKPSEVNMKEFYKKLGPRECQLNLPEDVMTSIFGPPQKIIKEAILGDLVNQCLKADEGDDKSDEKDDEKGNDDHTDEESERAGQELEPTDFVSVKIEPVDYSECETG